MKYLYFYGVTKINKLINKIPTRCPMFPNDRSPSWKRTWRLRELSQSLSYIYRVPPSTMGRRHHWEPIRMKKNQNAFNFHFKTIMFTKSPVVTNWVVCWVTSIQYCVQKKCEDVHGEYFKRNVKWTFFFKYKRILPLFIAFMTFNWWLLRNWTVFVSLLFYCSRESKSFINTEIVFSWTATLLRRTNSVERQMDSSDTSAKTFGCKRISISPKIFGDGVPSAK